MADKKLLKNIPLFFSFSDKELRKIIRVAKERSYAKDTIIFKEGQKGDALYIIISGEVAIEKQPLVKSVEAVATLHLKEGDFFGELSLFDQGERTSTARTLKDTRVIVLKASDFLRLAKEAAFASKLFQNSIQIIAARVRQTNKELMAFYEMGRILSLPYSMEDLFTNTLNIIISALQVRGGILLLKNEITGLLELKSVKGCKKEDIQGMDIANSPLATQVLSAGAPLIVADFLKEPALKGIARLGYEKKTMLLMPFAESSGLLILTGKAAKNKGEDVFTQNDANLAYAIMKQVEAVLANIRFLRDAEGRQKLQRHYFGL